MGQAIYQKQVGELSNRVNMLVHRDYRSSNGSIIKIYDDRIEFYNPGGLYGDLTLNNLLKFKYSSQTRNKLIADAFKEIGIIEKYGSGIKRIFTICDNYGIIPPKINANKNSFELVLYKDKTDQKTDQKTDEELIIELISSNRNITINEISVKINKGLTTTKTKILKLKEQNKLKRIGPDKGGYWEIIK